VTRSIRAGQGRPTGTLCGGSGLPQVIDVLRWSGMLKFIGGTVGIIFLIGLLVVIGLLALIF